MTDLADIRERLARIETKLDAHVTLEPRVRVLENWRNYMAGALAAVGLGVGYVAKVVFGH